MDVLADAQDILDELGVHFENSAPARRPPRRCSPPRCIYPIRGAVTFKSTGRHQRRLRRARQPRLRRRHRRRADHHRRGLRRRLLDHAGAQPRLRDEVADLAARSAPEPADRSSRRWRTASSSPKRRNTPVMLEVRIRACHVHGRFVAKDNKRADVHARRGAGEPARATPTASCCRRPASCTSRRRSSERWPAAVRLHQGAQAQRVLRPTATATSASSCRAACTTRVMRALRAARPRRRLRRHRRAALRAERHLSADRRRGRCASARGKRAVLMVEEGQPELHRAGARTRSCARRGIQTKLCTARTCCRWPANTPAPVLLDGRRGVPRALRAATLLGDRRRAPNASPMLADADVKALAEAVPAAPAGLLHRLPGAADLRRDEAGRAGARAAPRQRRHRLPPVLDPAAVQHRRTTMGYGLGPASRLGASTSPARQARDLGDGRRRLLAQRPDQRRRQRRLQQAATA